MDFGLDLLMNPKKRSSDGASICSGGDIASVKSLRIPSSHSSVSQITDDDDNENDMFGGGIRNQNTPGNFERIEINDIDDSISTISSRSSSELRQNLNQTYAKQDNGYMRSQSRSSSRAPSVRSMKSQSQYSSDNQSIASKSDMESLGSLLAAGTKKTKYQPQPVKMSNDDIIAAKRELLYQFDRLEKKGLKLPKKFTMASSLDDMKAEYERLKRDKDLDNAIRFQRRALMFFTSGVEMLTSKVDALGVNLDGWSESVHDNIEEYDDTFEELYDKYKGKAKMAPELKLVFALGMSAFTFNMTRSMMKCMPGVEQVFKQNPELMKQFAAATANTMKQEQPQGGLFSGLGGLFSNLFGGGSSSSGAGNMGYVGNQPSQDANYNEYVAQQQRPINVNMGTQQQPVFNMKGPSTNIDDIMKDLERNDNDRIEIMSTVTSSEFTELEDDVSINNLMYGKKKKSGGRKITLDI